MKPPKYLKPGDIVELCKGWPEYTGRMSFLISENIPCSKLRFTESVVVLKKQKNHGDRIMTDISGRLSEQCDRLKSWLFNDALPIWTDAGVDRKNGGFFERLGMEGAGLNEPKRARVQPRQIYCLLEAGRLGWKNWSETAERTLDFFLSKYSRSDGSFFSSVSPDGKCLDDSFSLYNQAFAIFAFAHVADSMPHLRSEMIGKSDALLDLLRNRYAHPDGGFEEDIPRRLPLCSNPHMHLFEACLAWESVTGFEPWGRLADEIANQCLNRFIDRESGVLREFFDGNWHPVKGDLGKIVEPGHQLEWCWLLMKWGKSRNSSHALAKAKKLYEIGVGKGIDSKREVVVMGLHDNFTVQNSLARLWSQTEWLKAATILAQFADSESERSSHEVQMLAAISAIWKFLDVPMKGLWNDKLTDENRFVEEPVPASTFYHIVCALSELFNYCKMLKNT